MDDKVRLSVLGFSFNQTQTGTYGLVLAEEDGQRRLMVIVGTPEAQSIAFKLQNSAPPRPLTHDLFQMLLSSFKITLLEVDIYKYENGVFFSQLLLKQGEETITIESRTSDAVGIALRTKSPIFTTEAIMKELAVILDDNAASDDFGDDERDNIALDYSLLNEEELESLLEDAVNGEDYELASILRDELEKKKGDE
ncbi:MULTISPECIES: bifunctional nuclease family protein [unclassified Dysgonomonas]|uniref:bifunctional nuclease family protein n=1 Tax=unclassified Dysgonomonas TaxID=2630389 RepID=UPI0013EB54B9|nr:MULTISPECIES: bifunctional nuclease family protein [unclassified Dysgonomonas]